VWISVGRSARAEGAEGGVSGRTMVVLVLECGIGVEVLWSLTEGCDVEIGRAAKII
jgi:hypothetical protein